MKQPNQPDLAQLLGDVNLRTCKYTVDSLADTSPLGEGFCTAAAYPADNPVYNVDADPAPKPKHIVAEVGAGC
jgi:hypothetical protein